MMLKDQSWTNYEKIRSHLIGSKLLHVDRSKYWEEESSSIEYLLDATPAIISRLRDHCHWLTGVRSYDYKSHHSHKLNTFTTKYFALRELDPNLPFYGELGVLGDYGFQIEENMINLDTLKFFESVMALNVSGNLLRLKNMSRPIIVEIGAGWGGFLAMLKQYVPNAQMIIVDLPHTLIFSATYLPTAFPNSTVGFFGSSDFSGQEDFIFMTSEQFPEWNPMRIDLAINMVSFQEMTSAQVADYGKGLLEKNCSVLYSHNRDKSAHNKELISVELSLSDWYYSNTVELLDVDYTILRMPQISKNDFSDIEELSGKMKLLGFIGKILAKLPKWIRKKVNAYISVVFSEKVKAQLLRHQKRTEFSSISKKGYSHKFYFSDKDLEHLGSIN